MTHPLRIKVAHLEYQILPMTPKHVLYEGSNYGLHIAVDNHIYIDASQASPAEQVRILFHELIHAMFWAYNISKESRDEEKTCAILESPLAALFRDNPHLPGVMAAAWAGKPLVVADEKKRR